MWSEEGCCIYEKRHVPEGTLGHCVPICPHFEFREPRQFEDCPNCLFYGLYMVIPYAHDITQSELRIKEQKAKKAALLASSGGEGANKP